ncbi:hypothetical protein Tco_1527854, partial [Tanacetum coccineum]
HFIGRLAHHFGLVSDDGLRGLLVVARELPLIDMGELVKLNICMEIGDDWAWVAPGPERQQVAVAGALEAAKDAHAVDEGTQVDPALIQAPQPPPPPPAAGRTMPQRLGRLEEEIQGLCRDVRSLCGLVESLMTDQSSSLAVSRDAPDRGLTRPALSQLPSSQTYDSSILSSVQLYYLIKPGSKFCTVVREYVIEPSKVSKSRAKLRRESVYKSVKAEEKSNLKTSL